jgi:predicted GNAT family acetyltransferase
MADLPPVVMNEAAHRFELTVDGETAFAEYKLLHDALVLPHTVTPPALEGRGIGSALVAGALALAKTEGLTITARCPFVTSFIKKHPEAV